MGVDSQDWARKVDVDTTISGNLGQKLAALDLVDSWEWQQEAKVAAAGTNNTAQVSVPAGEIWICSSIIAANESLACAGIRVRVGYTTGWAGSYAWVTGKAPASIYDALSWSGFLFLPPTSSLTSYFYGCGAGNFLTSAYLCFKLNIT